MRKMFNNLLDLLPDAISSFVNQSMFDELEEGDVIAVLPVEDAMVAKNLVDQTNTVLGDYFQVYDELCYTADSYLDLEENPLFFWKDYLLCFFDCELVEDQELQAKFPGTAYGMYQIVRIAYIDEVNARLKKRRLNGIRLEYKIKGTPMDRNKHWNRTYDKDF